MGNDPSADSERAPPPLADPLIGRQVGSYVIEVLLGVGGMGAVYRGVQPAIHKKVAIKFLAPHLNGNLDVVSRFFDEAKAVNLIGHENIVDIFDFGKTAEGQNYFVMELLDGPSLEKMLEKQKAISPSRAVDVGRQVASALAAAHKSGIIHRDLKPDNVFLVKRAGRNDFVKILDFGIAKLSPPEQKVEGRSGDTDRRTKSGMILGTPGYMAPEQASGDHIDVRADIYSLGVLVYRMLAGEVPFHAQSYTATLLRQLTETAKPLREVRKDCSPGLEGLVARMLARAPEDRPQSMTEVEEALVAMSVEPLGGEVQWSSKTAEGQAQREVIARQPTSIESPMTTLDPRPPQLRERDRRRGSPMLAIVGAAALVVGALAVVVFKTQGKHEANPPAPAAAPSPPAPSPALAPTPPPAPAPNGAPPDNGPFMVRVESSPPGAQIFLGERLVGVTPSNVTLDAEGPLMLKLPGHRSEQVDASRKAVQIVVELKKLAPKRPTPGLPRAPGGISLDD